MRFFSLKTTLAVLFIGSLNITTFANINAIDTSRIVAFDNDLKNQKSIDSSLVNFHNQLPNFQDKFSASLGNIALPQRNLFFDPKAIFGFRLMDNVYHLFEYNLSNQINYHAAKPLTDMGFGVGAKKESYFSFFHTQNFGKHFNFGSALRTSRTESFYLNQNPHYINFNVFASFSSPNRKYLITSNGIINRVYHKENGGIDTSTIFIKKNVLQNPEIVATNMSGAFVRKNSSSFSAKQYFNFNPTKKDTVEKDFYVEDYGQQHLYHQIEYAENWIRYTDTTLEDFHDQPKPIDKLGLREYLYHHKIENSFGYFQSIDSEKNNSFGIDVGAKHSYNYISQPDTNAKFNNIWAYANVDYTLKSKYKINAKYNQGIIGYNAGDLQLQAKIFITKNFFKQWFDIGLNVTNQLSQPTYIQEHYRSSHFNWENKFNKIDIKQYGFFMQGEKSNIQISYSQIKNFVYFDSTFAAKQYSKVNNLFQLNVNHPIKLNKLHINTLLLFQKNLSDTDVIRLPEYTISEQIYFEGWLFKRALFSQAGVELNYTPAYYGNGYLPLLNQFYNQDKFLVAGYPQLDVFFNFKIQQVRIFVKACNVNYGLYPTGIVYYQVPFHPMPPRMFRLGIIWRFWD